MLSAMCLCDCVRVWRGPGGGECVLCSRTSLVSPNFNPFHMLSHIQYNCTQIIVYNIFLGLANRNFAVCMAGTKRSCCSGGI
jgi:hypothetical protein